MADAASTTEEKAPPKAKAAEAPPVEESGPAILAGTAAYIDNHGNWSDPPELIEDQPEGSLAKPPQEELDEENAEAVKAEQERIAKAQEQNAKAAEAKAKEAA